MMEKHLPEVFALNVEELGDDERKVEAELDRVIPENVIGYHVPRVAYPTVSRVPQPRFLNEFQTKTKKLYFLFLFNRLGNALVYLFK